MDKTIPNNNLIRICVVDTPFTLFYYLLLFGVNENDIFIMSNHIPEPIRNNIDHIYFPVNKIYPYENISYILKDFYLLTRLVFELIILRIKLYPKTKDRNVKVYGHGHLLFSFPLYEYPNSALIEDGIGNYRNLPEFKEFSPIIKFIFHKIFGKYIRKPIDGFGTHPNIKKIYLTKNQGYCDLIKDKVIVNELSDLKNSIDETQKNKILKIFNVDTIIKNINDTDILLLTEPFSEWLELTLEEEIEIYEDIISKYDAKDIIIKPHPQEMKDYTKFFPNIRVITTPFPLELFDLMNVKFEKIITIHSSAALNFKDTEVEFYDGEINNENVNKGRELVKKQYYNLLSKNS